MRILIVATERSGSTTLMKGLSNVLGMTYIREPFLPKELDKQTYNLESNNIIVKTLIGQQIGEGGHINFLKKLTINFDKVILLGRKSTKDRFESLLHSIKSKDWHAKYKKSDDIHNHFSDIEKYLYKKHVLVTNELLEILSENIGIPIIWYEDLYSEKDKAGNIIKHLKIPHLFDNFEKLYYNYLNPSNRYLQDGKII